MERQLVRVVSDHKMAREYGEIVMETTDDLYVVELDDGSTIVANGSQLVNVNRRPEVTHSFGRLFVSPPGRPLHEQLIALRNKRGLKPAALARKAGVAASTVRNFERGNSTLIKLQRVVNALHGKLELVDRMADDTTNQS